MPDRYNRHIKALTLIEIIIVLAIIGIAALIAFPSYEKTMFESRRKDGILALAAMATEVEQIRLVHGNLNAAEIAKLSSQSSQSFYKLDYKATSDGYILSAEPQNQQTEDLKCATLSINHLGERFISGSATVKECWD